jgi:hypothetical protein
MKEVLNTKDYNTVITVRDASGKPRKLWQENKLGRFIRLWSGKELRVVGLTGIPTLAMASHNLVTNSGHKAANAKISGQGSYGNFTVIALGTGTTAAAATDTALENEITGNGGARATATATQTTTDVTDDTTTLTHTFTFTGAETVTEEGIFDSTTVAGSTMLAHQVFAAVNVQAGDTLTISHSYSS